MTNLSNVLAMPWTATNDTNRWSSENQYARMIGRVATEKGEANACYIRFNSSHPKCIA